jgi:hypothetical protein
MDVMPSKDSKMLAISLVSSGFLPALQDLSRIYSTLAESIESVFYRLLIIIQEDISCCPYLSSHKLEKQDDACTSKLKLAALCAHVFFSKTPSTDMMNAVELQTWIIHSEQIEHLGLAGMRDLLFLFMHFDQMNPNQDFILLGKLLTGCRSLVLTKESLVPFLSLHEDVFLKWFWKMGRKSISWQDFVENLTKLWISYHFDQTSVSHCVAILEATPEGIELLLMLTLNLMHASDPFALEAIQAVCDIVEASSLISSKATDSLWTDLVESACDENIHPLMWPYLIQLLFAFGKNASHEKESKFEYKAMFSFILQITSRLASSCQKSDLEHLQKLVGILNFLNLMTATVYEKDGNSFSFSYFSHTRSQIIPDVARMLCTVECY